MKSTRTQDEAARKSRASFADAAPRAANAENEGTIKHASSLKPLLWLLVPFILVYGFVS